MKTATNVERRSVYSHGRKRVVWDARYTAPDGHEYSRLGEPSRQAAVDAIIRDVEFVAEQGSFEAGGCAVRPDGFDAWTFYIGDRGVMGYGGLTLFAAASYAAWSYRDHPEAQDFRRAVADRWNADGTDRAIGT